ncbi:MAG: rhodanese-like domain-containing protein [Afipia sp.]|nr:rhodanese-like domain-containing protein [Afipia sp.]
MTELLKIVGDATKVTISTPAGPVEIVRTKNDMQLIKGVLQAIIPVAGVRPIGELEVLDALKGRDFRVVDMREPKWRLKSPIPGSISIPYNEITQRLDELGCTRKGAGWDCAGATNMVAFCNGPACPQSPTAIRAMVHEGFSAERIHYYRGGMQDWLVLGLTATAVPAAEA